MDTYCMIARSLEAIIFFPHAGYSIVFFTDDFTNITIVLLMQEFKQTITLCHGPVLYVMIWRKQLCRQRMDNAPLSIQKKTLYQNHISIWGYSMLFFVISFLFLLRSMKITLLAGPRCFLSFDAVLQSNFIVLHWKDVSNTEDCVIKVALKYDRPLLICRDHFLRIGFASGCMYFYGTLLWKYECVVYFITLYFIGKVWA